MRTRSLLALAQLWRWRRVRRHGVVLVVPRQPAPLGIAYTWDGRCVGTADRDHLARQLTRTERRRQHAVAADIRRAHPGWPGRD
ncbi:hypothetical protein [Actinophytocola sp.]|uniref:hypothetical protein n=1 Tax=Actinophytocola sp. TaxID=1872138 RepID=UPI002D7E7609|nr:hypothetical protein [Actinophytocola sp.]HET9144074.1 hypothetical protein [Actinophytocola sp.]